MYKSDKKGFLWYNAAKQFDLLEAFEKHECNSSEHVIRKTRGGITSVVKAHETGPQWKKFHCRWIQTHRDGNAVRKLWYLCTALVQYVCLLPFYDVVHIHIATAQSARRKRLFFYPAKWLGKRTIFHFHPSNEKFLFEPYNARLYRTLFSTRRPGNPPNVWEWSDRLSGMEANPMLS